MSIKVLIVDDSIVFRHVLAKGLQVGNDIEIIATAANSFDARDKILQYNPDVVTCDIEMPEMDGITFIKRLIPQYPIPVIVVSSLTNKVFDAMNAGAIDFVKKPDANSAESVRQFILELIQKIKIASNAKIQLGEALAIHRGRGVECDTHEIIAIGASTGGTEAIFTLLKQLPLGIPGIVIVQHIPAGFSKMFAERLNLQTHFEVKEAQDGDDVKRNHVYIAPGDRHIKIVSKNNGYSIKVFKGEKVNGHCPSVDVLFDSVAKTIGVKALGVILTGMGYDGARGIANMKRKGAFTLGQDEKSSVVYGMPRVAYELGGLSKQVSLELMGRYIMRYLK